MEKQKWGDTTPNSNGEGSSSSFYHASWISMVGFLGLREMHFRSSPLFHSKTATRRDIKALVRYSPNLVKKSLKKYAGQTEKQTFASLYFVQTISEIEFWRISSSPLRSSTKRRFLCSFFCKGEVGFVRVRIRSAVQKKKAAADSSSSTLKLVMGND